MSTVRGALGFVMVGVAFAYSPRPVISPHVYVSIVRLELSSGQTMVFASRALRCVNFAPLHAGLAIALARMPGSVARQDARRVYHRFISETHKKLTSFPFSPSPPDRRGRSGGAGRPNRKFEPSAYASARKTKPRIINSLRPSTSPTRAAERRFYSLAHHGRTIDRARPAIRPVKALELLQ